MDESERPPRVLCVAVSIQTVHVESARQTLRSLVLPGQRRIHFSKESDPRRRQILSVMGRLPVTPVSRWCVSSATLTKQQARALCIRGLLESLIHEGRLGTLVIESREEPLDVDDRRLIESLYHKPGFVYRHASPYEEPMLWVPDAVAWTLGKGRRWTGRLPAAWRGDHHQVGP